MYPSPAKRLKDNEMQCRVGWREPDHSRSYGFTLIYYELPSTVINQSGKHSLQMWHLRHKRDRVCMTAAVLVLEAIFETSRRRQDLTFNQALSRRFGLAVPLAVR
jgi:hypothetical protein